MGKFKLSDIVLTKNKEEIESIGGVPQKKITGDLLKAFCLGNSIKVAHSDQRVGQIANMIARVIFAKPMEDDLKKGKPRNTIPGRSQTS